MFEIKKSYEKSPRGDDKMVVDECRNVWLQFLYRRHYGKILAMRIVVENKTIPFRLFIRGRDKGEENKTTYEFYEFNSKYVAEEYGFTVHDMDDNVKIERIKMMIIEGVICFGFFYNGFDFEDGQISFYHNGKFYTKSNFQN